MTQRNKLKPVLTVGIAAVISLTALSCKTRAHNNASIRSDRPTADNCGTPGAKGNPNPAHCEGPVYFEGEYTFIDNLDTLKKDDDVIRWAGGSSMPFVSKLFGTTTMYTPSGTKLTSVRTGKPHIVRDLQYLVASNKVGIRIIPITVGTETEATSYSNGFPTKPIKGSNILDEKIRKQQGIPDGAPVFAAAVYNYPGAQFVALDELASEKSQGGFGHMSVYIGNGVSKHSPQGLHDERWSAAPHGEPSTIISLGLEGADQVELNKNMIAWTWILNTFNDGPNFPGDFEFDPVRVTTLQAHNEFARKWIMGEVDALKSDRNWGTYCAESANMSINLGMNVPLTEEYFVKVWAPNKTPKTVAYAKALFRKLKERYLTEIVNKESDKPTPSAEQVDAFKFLDKPFVPLWEQQGVSPLSSKVNEGMPYAVDTSTDILSSLIENFAAWPDVGPAISAMSIASLADLYKERLGVEPVQFMSSAIPIMALGFAAHATTLGLKTDSEVTNYIDSQFKTPGFPSELSQLLQPSVLQLAPRMKRDAAVPMQQAWLDYQTAVRPIVEQSSAWAPKISIAQQRAAREKNVANLRAMADTIRNSGDAALADSLIAAAERTDLKVFVRFNSPPSLLFRVANGIKKPADKVKVSIVGTIFDAEMVREKRPGEEAVFELDELRRLLPEQLKSDQGKKWDGEMEQGH